MIETKQKIMQNNKIKCRCCLTSFSTITIHSFIQCQQWCFPKERTRKDLFCENNKLFNNKILLFVWKSFDRQYPDDHHDDDKIQNNNNKKRLKKKDFRQSLNLLLRILNVKRLFRFCCFFFTFFLSHIFIWNS